MVQHPAAVLWAGPQELLHLCLLWTKLKGKSRSFFTAEAEGTSLCGVGSSVGGTIAMVRGLLRACVCEERRGSIRACPPPGWWPLHSSAGLSCSGGSRVSPWVLAALAGPFQVSSGMACSLPHIFKNCHFGMSWSVRAWYNGVCSWNGMLAATSGLWSRPKCQT